MSLGNTISGQATLSGSVIFQISSSGGSGGSSGIYVAISAGGPTAYSSDGVTWTQGSNLIIQSQIDIYGYQSVNWISIAYGNNKFVAIENNGVSSAGFTGQEYAYSSDGMNWTVGNLPFASNWDSVAYGDGKFVAVASFDLGFNPIGLTAYSTDGINWSTSAISNPDNLSFGDIKYANGKFVSFAGCDSNFNPTQKAAYSTDGISWTNVTLPVADYWYRSEYGNGIWYAAGVLGNSISSTDGITWTVASPLLRWDGVPLSTFNLAYGDSKFEVLSNQSLDGFGGPTFTLYSSDGVTWTQGTGPEAGYSPVFYGAMIYANGKFVAVNHDSGDGGLTDQAAYSTDGISWTNVTLPVADNWTALGTSFSS